MNRLHRVLIAIGVAALPHAVSAQSVPEVAELTREERLARLFADITPQTQIRLVTIGRGVEDVTFLGYADSSVDIRQDGYDERIAYEYLQSVSVEGGHSIQGAIWGAGGGALAGVFFGAMYGSFSCNTTEACNRTERQGAFRWGTFLGLVGGGLGYYFGRKDVHWHSIFP